MLGTSFCLISLATISMVDTHAVQYDSEITDTQALEADSYWLLPKVMPPRNKNQKKSADADFFKQEPFA
ncbi:hypothetical protein [Marinomonas arenicola]|uniref:Uncharacterized protein n=1 Tax=Marinomonas arenicola TaxID=569601 RepID=A0ABU9G190_9GAMM